MSTKINWSRRQLLGGIPYSLLALRRKPSTRQVKAHLANKRSPKFNALDIARYFTASSMDFVARERARSLSPDGGQDGLLRIAASNRDLAGIPFQLGSADTKAKSWMVLSQEARPWCVNSVEIPLKTTAAYFCIASFCEWDPHEEQDWVPTNPPPKLEDAGTLGQQLAEATLTYVDGSKHSVPIRRGFEVSSPSCHWGLWPSAAVPHRKDIAVSLKHPMKSLDEWIFIQAGVWDGKSLTDADSHSQSNLWICALENPHPEKKIDSLHLTAKSKDPLIVCGITLFRGRENPLRYEELRAYRIMLPNATATGSSDWEVDVDLGVIARRYDEAEFDPVSWLGSAYRDPHFELHRPAGGRRLYVEIAASPEATIYLRQSSTGSMRQFDVGRFQTEPEVESAGARIEFLDRHKVWVQGQIVDSGTGRPTPARLAFRSKDGRYLPPYGHRADVNAELFQDFGGDLKLEDESFAYVDGSFQIELPVGEVYVDISKGFEFERVRQKITIDPKERELHLEIPRSFDLRKLGWVTADTHVHVLSPSTALLEAQAEGVNLINLLAAQIGKYFINVGDLAQGQLVSGDGEVLIRMGTENREHILGHIGLLGGSAPSFPMSAGGPPESSIGDPLWSTLAEWADQCQRRDGLTVAMHFPYPRGEWATNVVLNKLDAVELFPYSEHFSTLGFLDWYRYLNCGYRLPIVGGTDKMGAWTPVGANRTYANLGQSEFSFSNWAQAVRNGNTFISTGPVLLFSVEGHEPGHEIAVGAAGGTVEFSVTARSSIPFHRIEVIFNGEVVASREESRGTSRVDISDRIHVAGPGWLAARCVSQLTSSSRLGSVPSRVWICAHTSPVYLVVPGQELFSPDVAAYLLTQIECAETYLKEIATRPESARFRESLGVFAQARKRLHDRMHEHQRSHEHP